MIVVEDFFSTGKKNRFEKRSRASLALQKWGREGGSCQEERKSGGQGGGEGRRLWQGKIYYPTIQFFFNPTINRRGGRVVPHL